MGAESCPIAEEAVPGAHLILSSANFCGESSSPLDAEAGGALPQIIDDYNNGFVCTGDESH